VHEKEQIQDFRNWVLSSSEGTSRSAPESPIIGLIENPSVSTPSVETSDKPKSEVFEHTPAAAEGTSNAAGLGSSGAEGSKGPVV
jgi:hypothetical protein